MYNAWDKTVMEHDQSWPQWWCTCCSRSGLCHDCIHGQVVRRMRTRPLFWVIGTSIPGYSSVFLSKLVGSSSYSYAEQYCVHTHWAIIPSPEPISSRWRGEVWGTKLEYGLSLVILVTTIVLQPTFAWRLMSSGGVDNRCGWTPTRDGARILS